MKSGAVAQLGECSVRNAEVVGSIPIGSTLKSMFPVRYWPGRVILKFKNTGYFLTGNVLIIWKLYLLVFFLVSLQIYNNK